MNKIIIICLTAALLAIFPAGCAKADSDTASSSASSTVEDSSEAPSDAPSEEPEASSGAEASSDAEANPEVSVDKILTAIAAAYGDDYPPNGEIPPEVLESEFGLTPDLYVAAKGEMAMISAHNDRVVVAQAAPGKADALEKALNDARQRKIDDTLQYPANIAKTNAAKVVRNGDYVAFLLVGVPNDNVDATPEESIDYAEAQVQMAVDAFNGVFAA